MRFFNTARPVNPAIHYGLPPQSVTAHRDPRGR